MTSKPTSPPSDTHAPTVRQQDDVGGLTWPPSPVMPDPGEVPKDRYQPDHLLGEGGMGEVTLARDHLIGRAVALKQLRNDIADRPDAQKRFAREARIQGQLEHPAIVPVYDLGVSASGTPYFTMKSVRGVSLREVLDGLVTGVNPSIPLSRRRILSAFSQICLAAQYAHERGVIHRDIKPENIMLGHYGEVYLLDWGIAKVAATNVDEPDESLPVEPADSAISTREGSFLGTVGYAAPEQARGAQKDIDARSDVYSLGAILFEILTLEPLHERAPFEEMVRRTLEGVDSRPSVRAPNAGVPPELDALCVAATRPRPEERLESAAMLYQAIESFLDGDRDLELRRKSSMRHAEAALQAADEVLQPGGGSERETDRRAQALNEVGKALALDPNNAGALRTFWRLLTTPPRKIPTDVAQEEVATQRQLIGRAARLAAVVYIYALVNSLVIYAHHMKSWTGFLPSVAIWGCAAVASGVTAFRKTYAGLFSMLFLGTVATVCSTPVLSPILLIPNLLAAQAVLFCLMREWRRRFAVIAMVSVGWTLSLFGERLGLFPNTVQLLSDGFYIHSPMVDMSGALTTVQLYTVFLAMILFPAILVGAMREAYSKADLQLRLQTWQLQQLVSNERQAPGDAT